MDERTPVITGLGVVAPGGIGSKDFWQLLVDGRTATRPITLFDASGFRSRIAAEVDFDPAAHGLDPRRAAHLDRMTQFALVSAAEAVADSGLELAECAAETAVVIGSAVGATTSLEREFVGISGSGASWVVDPRTLSPHGYSYLVPSATVAEVARAVGAGGPSALISTGCTAGIDAVAHASELIREGSAEVAVVGATEAPISPISSASFDAILATTADDADPASASRPFDRRRSGFVLAEGAAMFVLETAGRARRRGAGIYCALPGEARRANAFHMTGLRPDGLELAGAIRAALDDARLDPTAVDYVSAHGSGTQQNDRHETMALKRALGPHAYRVPVSSIKSMVGHSLGAIGSIEIAACALALRHQVVPPTANLAEPDPFCDLDYVPRTARDVRLRSVLTVGSGFGGFQSAMVLSDVGALA
ncbi:beta-ketoacyl-[acyl-carrier-protein] synthase family protein [Nocardia brasiliensis]|uniref:beta-ketoacyl-[acyl-carrier-protein] synthase family protein n=1 Tax=Nocardia brasiliensis TaxID=37326 RepID=UPI002454FF78|nr:beta-ketoacyl-[acyl-carrier-protein] synthase family protein [Nocardia brasiliensis]